MSVLSENSYDIDGENTRQFFAEERYQSPSEAVREIAGNGYAAIQRAARAGYMDLSDGVIRFVVGDNLEVYDNGIGVPEDEADELRTVSDSSSQDDPFILGSYGIGRFSAIMLSDDDHFDFITHSREDDSSYGVRLGIDQPSEIDETLEEYGSMVRVALADDINQNDIVKWIKKELRWLPVEVIVETDEDTFTTGQTEFSDDVGGHTIHYEDENVELLFHNNYDVHSNATSGLFRNTKCDPRGGIALYNGMPVKTPTRVGGPKQFSFHIKREDGAEIEGPHGETTHLPQTTNDRGRLKEDNYGSFIEWCNDIYRHFGARELQSAVDEHDSLEDLADDDRVLFNVELVSEIDCPADVRVLLENWNLRLPSFTKDGYAGSRYRHDIQEAINEYDVVFVGKTFNERKAEVIKDLYDNPLFLCTKDRHRDLISYQDAQKLGWNLLKEVPLDAESLNEMGVSPDTIEEVMTTSSSPVTVYTYDYRNTRNKSRVSYSSPHSAVNQDEVIVVFTKGQGPNISDHWDLISSDVAVSNASQSDAEEMAEYDNVILYDDLEIQEIDQRPVYREGVSDRVVDSYVDGEWFDIGEPTPEFIVSLSKSDFRLLSISPSGSSFDITKKDTVRWDQALARETFPEEDEEVQDELASLGPDSRIWERMTQ